MCADAAGGVGSVMGNRDVEAREEGGRETENQGALYLGFN